MLNHFNRDLNLEIMSRQYPMRFTLENGTHVLVNRISNDTFDFTLNKKEGPSSHFIYTRDDGRTKTEIEDPLSFDEVDALRKFWLETEDIV